MATFKALNIESDDESDIEIDDTKEIQIEEALKLYQNALKYHSDGVQSYDQATEAYQQLFNSDIFKWPESQAELRRLELLGPLPEQDAWVEEVQNDTVYQPLSSGEYGASTLPQILHLAHKNYGDFLLDKLASRLKQNGVLDAHSNLNDLSKGAFVALTHFVDALDKDDSDLDLWSKTSDLGNALGSHRIARYCLEAILDGDDEALNGTLNLPGLAETLAGQRLCLLVRNLTDSLSLLQSPLSEIKRKKLSRILKQKLERYASHQHRPASLGRPQPLGVQMVSHGPSYIKLDYPGTWEDLADVLLQQLEQQSAGSNISFPGAAISFETGEHTTKDPSPKGVHSEQTPSLPLTERHMSSVVADQFPGLDDGRPTAPIPAFGISTQKPVNLLDGATRNRSADPSPRTSMSLPARKRSSEAAGIADPSTESGRLKSKRLRARESLVDSVLPAEQAIPKDQQRFDADLAQYQAVDDWCFDTMDRLLVKLGLSGFGNISNMRSELLASTSDLTAKPQAQPVRSDGDPVVQAVWRDLYELLSSHSEDLLTLFLQSSKQPEKDSTLSDVDPMALLQRHAAPDVVYIPQPLLDLQEGLEDFIMYENAAYHQMQDVGIDLIHTLLAPGSSFVRPQMAPHYSSYTGHEWSERLKGSLTALLAELDRPLYNKLAADLGSCHQYAASHPNMASCTSSAENWAQCVEVIQTLFEIHVEMATKSQGSDAETDTSDQPSVRTARWADLARDAMTLRASHDDSPKLSDALNLRYLWAATTHIALCRDVTKDHIIICWQQIREIFISQYSPLIRLPNNAAMSLMCVEAVDQEISRLTTSDFFARIFGSSGDDPVAIIESLEPLLDHLHAHTEAPTQHAEKEMDVDDIDGTDTASVSETGNAGECIDGSAELVDLLKDSPSSVRLDLWRRLRGAYETINYEPMVISCSFRMLELLLDDLHAPAHHGRPPNERQTATIKTLVQSQDILTRVLAAVKISDTPFERLDDAKLKSALRSLTELLKLLHSSNCYEDEVRVGRRAFPAAENGLDLASLRAVLGLLHDLQLHAWVVTYLLIKEVAKENKDLFPVFDDDRMEVLRSIHRAIGMRGFCGGANYALLNLIKKEVVQLSHIEGYDLEFSQILYDMYGLRCFLNPSYEQLEHDCQQVAFMDRSAAMQAADLLLTQVRKVKLVDLPKLGLKDAIERVHGLIARKKPSDAILRNREIYRAFFKSPINPVDLFRCLCGEGDVSITAVTGQQTTLATLAGKGWYFLMGQLSLGRFRSQKRTAPGPTEDLDNALAFFLQDLEYGADKWETWYRLAQGYDSKIDDLALWTSEKLNTAMSELAQYQRSAIHCYILATAQVIRSGKSTASVASKRGQLYGDFASRIYASSRQPFGMQAFSVDDCEKFISTQSIQKVKPFAKLSEYTAWKFAKTLYQRAITCEPEDWMLHYMLAKCLWKMHTASDAQSLHNARPSAHRVVAAVTRAINLLPRNKKDPKRDTILEPHYKLVSLLHKLVTKGEIQPMEACRLIRATPFARKVDPCEDPDAWVEYVLNVVKALRSADKANWQHRIVARAAQTIYDDGGGDFTAAIGAKHELTQQMFTKTMTLQIWKPECERPGRHFVYTAEYTRFFIKILEQLNDRASLDALARRVRKRQGEYFEHGNVWQELCTAYMKVLRRYGKVPAGHETAIFSGINHEDFLKRKDPLEAWCQSKKAGSPVLDVVREAIDLKKINGTLMKPGAIDDLIGDAYALLYETIGQDLWIAHLRDQKELKQIEDAKEAERQQQLQMAERKKMMGLSHLMNIDGASDMSAASSTAEEPPPSTAETAMTGESADHNAPPARRKVGVGRRELRLCAEACVVKASANTNVVEPPSDRRVKVVIPARKRTGDSPPRSPRDSADDEDGDDDSELSDVDEDVVNDGTPQKAGSSKEVGFLPMMFPGLNREEHVDGSDVENGGSDDEDGSVKHEGSELADLPMEDGDDEGASNQEAHLATIEGE